MKRLNSLGKSGQAATEMAILGALIIMAFSWIMNFGQSLAATQQAKMEAFRRAAQKSYEKNAAVTYTVKKNLRNASMNSGYGQGTASSVGASATVMWQKGTPGLQDTDDETSFAYWRFGDDEHEVERLEKKVINLDGSEKLVMVPASVYNEEQTRTEKYSSSVNRSEDKDKIRYAKKATLEDTTRGRARVRFDEAVNEDPWDDEVPTPEYVERPSISFSDTQNYTTNTSWETAHDKTR